MIQNEKPSRILLSLAFIVTIIPGYMWSMNSKSMYGFPLHYAISQGNTIDSIKDIIEINKININTKNDSEETPLFLALEKRSLPVIKYLVDNKANVNATNCYNLTPLLLAVRNKRDLEVIKYLVENKADINAQGGFDGSAPLHIAIEKRMNFEIIKYLIENKAYIKAQDKLNRTCLFQALENKYDFDVIRCLVENKAYVNAPGLFEHPPLLFIALDKKYDVEIIKYLIKNKADVNAESRFYGTCLFRALDYKHDVAVIKCLVENKAYVQSRYLYKAIENGNFEIITYLIKNKADLNIKNGNSPTPLFTMIENKNFKLIEYLNDQAIDLRIQKNGGEDILSYARKINNNMESKIIALQRAWRMPEEKKRLFIFLLINNRKSKQAMNRYFRIPKFVLKEIFKYASIPAYEDSVQLFNEKEQQVENSFCCLC